MLSGACFYGGQRRVGFSFGEQHAAVPHSILRHTAVSWLKKAGDSKLEL